MTMDIESRMKLFDYAFYAVIAIALAVLGITAWAVIILVNWVVTK